MYGILFKIRLETADPVPGRDGSQAGGRYAEALYQRLYLAGASGKTVFRRQQLIL